MLLVLLLILLLPAAWTLYEQCNHLVELRAGQKIYVNSPYYPGEYPRGTSCRYTITAPVDYVLSLRCELQLQSPATDSRCRSEVFHFNAEGDELLTSSEYFCGTGKFERQSFLNRAVISYISSGQPQATQLLPKLRDKLTTTTTTTTTSTTKAPAALQETLTNDELTDDVLHVLQDVRVSNALAYMAALLYNEPAPSPNNGHGLAGGSYLSIAKTSLKRARIVSGFQEDVSNLGAGEGGGRFSCLVQALAPVCECGWSLREFTLRIASPLAAEAALHEFPPMAGVLTKKQGKVFCGAVIIHQHYLLSAAHCFLTPQTNKASLLRIVVGEHDLSSIYESLYTRRYDLEALTPHEQFSQRNGQLRNDIALLRTRLPIVWSRSVGPACLPLRPLHGKKLPLAGQQVQAAGWGTTAFGGPQTQRLLKTTLDVINTTLCRSQMVGNERLPGHSFCTYTPGQDTCQYDSGGALYESSSGRLLAVGIVSYGYGCASGQPSVNTRIASFVKWIRSKTPEVQYCAR